MAAPTSDAGVQKTLPRERRPHMAPRRNSMLSAIRPLTGGKKARRARHFFVQHMIFV
jgi:hypothetical protein